MAGTDIIALLKADTSDFNAKMLEAKGEVKDLSDTGSSNFSKLATVGKAAFLGLGAAAVGVGVASVDLADKYQTATNTIAANGDISIASANKIGKAFLGTAGTTIYSAQNIATAFGAVAGQVKIMNGGVLNAKAAMDVMRPAMDLAEASGTNLNSATSDITTTLQAFSLNIKSSPLVSNVLFNAARDTGTSVDSLSNAIDKARAKMGSAAPPVQQMGGLLVDLAQHGETGRAAMTALGSAFTGIISPTKAVTAAQNAAGVSFINANGQLKPMDQILAQLQPKIAGMGNAQATAELKSLGFGAASAKLLGVVQAGPAAFDKATASVEKQNSAHAAAEKQAQTLSHQIETLKSSVEDEGVKLGQVLIPKLEDLMKITMKVVEWLGKHKAVAETLAIVLGGAVAVAIAAYTASMIAAAAATIAASAPILAVIAVIALLAAAVYEVISHWGAIEDFFKGIWKDVDDVFHTAISDIVNIIKGWWPLILGIMTGGVGLLPALLIKYWSQIKSDVIQYFGDVVSFLASIPGKILSLFEAAGSWLLSIGKDIINGLYNGIVDEWNTIGDIGNTILGWISKAFDNAGTWLLDAGKNLLIGLWNGIVNGESWLFNQIANVGKDIIHGFESILGIGSPSKITYQHGLYLMQGLANGIKDGAGAAISAYGGVADAIGGNGGISPITGGGVASSTSTGQSPVYLQINGQTFATLMLPAIQTAALQAQRGQSLPVFGTTQSAA